MYAIYIREYRGKSFDRYQIFLARRRPRASQVSLWICSRLCDTSQHPLRSQRECSNTYLEPILPFVPCREYLEHFQPPCLCQSHVTSDGKVRFSSVQSLFFPNPDLDHQFSSRDFPEPELNPRFRLKRVQFRFRKMLNAELNVNPLMAPPAPPPPQHIM